MTFGTNDDNIRDIGSRIEIPSNSNLNLLNLHSQSAPVIQIVKSRKYVGPCVPGIEADNIHNIDIINEISLAYTPKLSFSGTSAHIVTIESHKILA